MRNRRCFRRNKSYRARLEADRRNVRDQTLLLRRLEQHLVAMERMMPPTGRLTIKVNADGRMKLTEEDGREIVRALRQMPPAKPRRKRRRWHLRKR